MVKDSVVFEGASVGSKIVIFDRELVLDKP